MLANGGAQIVKEGETIELDAAEVAALRMALRERAMPGDGDRSAWNIDIAGDLCYDDEYICSGDPEVNNQTPEESARIILWVIRNQPDINAMDREYITSASSYDVAIYLQEWIGER